MVSKKIGEIAIKNTPNIKNKVPIINSSGFFIKMVGFTRALHKYKANVIKIF